MTLGEGGGVDGGEVGVGEVLHAVQHVLTEVVESRLFFAELDEGELHERDAEARGPHVDVSERGQDVGRDVFAVGDMPAGVGEFLFEGFPDVAGFFVGGCGRSNRRRSSVRRA